MFAGLNRHQAKAPAPDKPARADAALDGKARHEPNPLWQSLALCSARLQPKLTVSQPDDPYEREADHIADRVLRMAEPQVQRTCAPCAAGNAPCPQCDEEEPVLRKANTLAAPSETTNPVEGTMGAGHLLDPSVRAFAEPRFGADLGALRVHHDATDRMRAAKLDARAFTYGTHIWLRTQLTPIIEARITEASPRVQAQLQRLLTGMTLGQQSLQRSTRNSETQHPESVPSIVTARSITSGLTSNIRLAMPLTTGRFVTYGLPNWHPNYRRVSTRRWYATTQHLVTFNDQALQL